MARAEDWTGPWLWALDVESKVSRRVTTGLEQYMSVSASRNGSRGCDRGKPHSQPVARAAFDGRVEVRDAEPYPAPTERALAPRFHGTSLFYLSLSTRGTGDGLWRVQNGQAFEVTRGADSVFTEPAAVSPDGSRVAVVVRQQGKRHLAVMSADGTNSRTLAASIEIQGVVGQSAADWSPDGTRIVVGGRDAQGPGLFMIPVDGGAPERLVADDAFNPVWSPKGDLIVYGAGFGGAGAVSLLRGVRPDGTACTNAGRGGPRGRSPPFPAGRHGRRLPAKHGNQGLLAARSRHEPARQLTHLSDRGFLNTFDITPDGRYLVFDLSRQNSDVVLIDVPPK